MLAADVELVVMRGTAYNAANSGSLYCWATEVVRMACSERRDVRVCDDI